MEHRDRWSSWAGRCICIVYPGGYQTVEHRDRWKLETGGSGGGGLIHRWKLSYRQMELIDRWRY